MTVHRLIVQGKPVDISVQLRALQDTGLFNNGPSIPINLTDEEMLREIRSDLNATARERDLADRLADALDGAEYAKEIEELKASNDDLAKERDEIQSKLETAETDRDEYESLYRAEVRKASELQERVDQLENETIELAKENTMLEQHLIENTKMLGELNASIRELLARTTSAQSETEAPKKGAKAEKAKADTPADPAPEKAAPEKSAKVTYNEVREAIQQLVVKNRPKAVEILAGFEAKTLKDVPEDKWGAVLVQVKAELQ